MDIGIFVFAMILLLIVLIMQKSVAIKALIIHIQYNAYAAYATLIVNHMMEFSAFLQHYKFIYNMLEAEILYDSICSTNIGF